MYTNLDELDEDRASTSEHVIAQKKQVAKAYNKHVRLKQFDVGDLI